MRIYLFFLVFFLHFTTLSQQDSTVKTYEGIYYSDLDIVNNEDYSSFALLDSVVNKYNIFFTGENHLYRNSNYRLQLKMLKYLHKKRGVRHLLLEFGFSRGYLVNNYVLTGDTTIYKMLDDYSYDEYAKLYHGIREYNKTLDSNDRIHVHGIDLERSYLTSVKVLNLMLPRDNKQIPDSIALDIEALRSLMGYNDKHYNKYEFRENNEREFITNSFPLNTFSELNTIKQVIKGFKRNQQEYRSYLSDNFHIFQKVLNGMSAEIKRKNFMEQRMFHAKIFRESYMFDQFIHLIDSLEGERFFSQFGRCHTAMEEQDEWCNFYHFKTLASRISKSGHPALKDKVCSIAAYYPKSEGTWLQIDEGESIRKLVKDLNIAEGDITLIKLNNDTTSLEIKTDIFGSLSDKFQFIIINNNTLDGDRESGEEDKNDYTYVEPLYWNLTADIKINYFNHKGFNEVLQLNGISSFGDFVPAIGGSFTYFENWYSYFNMYYYAFKSRTARINDSTSFDFKGNNFGILLGGELTKSRTFNIAPYSGLSISNYAFDLKQSQNTTRDGFFSGTDVKEDNYRNFGLLLEAGVDFRLNVSLIALSVSVGYQYDMSNKYWKVNGKRANYSSKTSFSAPYATLKLGLNLHD